MTKLFRYFTAVVCLCLASAAVPKESTFIIVTLNSAGSQSDASARYYAPLLEAHLGRSVSVVNAPGGDGLVGMRLFSLQNNDCDSVMLGNSSVVFQSIDPEKAGINPMKQFVPVHGMSNNYALVVVPQNSPIRNLKDLQTYGKIRKLNAGAFSLQTKVSIGLMDKILGLNTEVISYKQSEQMANDLAGSRLDFSLILSGTSGVQNLIDLGKIRPIAALTNHRLTGYDNVPTMAEQGFETPETFYWAGFFVNKSASRSCRQYLERIFAMTLNSDLGDKYSLLPGGPSRMLIGSEQLREMMQKQLKYVIQLMDK